MTLQASTISNIVISHVKSFWRHKPRIVLSANTIVKGDILFENGQKGVVIVKDGAVIH